MLCIIKAMSQHSKLKYTCEGAARRVCMEQDFLDEMIEESTRRNPEFPSLMEEARQRRALLEALAALRSRSRISQSALAKRIHTSQPPIPRLQARTVYPPLSPLPP